MIPLSIRRESFIACLLAAAACAPVETGETGDERLVLEDLEVHATVDPSAPTAIRLAWESPEAGESWVEYLVLGETPQETEATGSADGMDAVLVGLPADTDVCFSAYTQTSDALHRGFGCTRTLSWPMDVPRLVLTSGSREDVLSGFLLVPFAGPGTGTMLVDRKGRVVWFWPGDPDAPPMNARVAPSGGVLVLNSPAPWTPEGGSIQHSFLGGSNEELPAPGIHHALAALPDGGLAFISADVRTVTLENGNAAAVAGDTILIRHRDGTLEELFSTWDWSTPEEIDVGDGFYGEAANWLHANSLDVHPTRNTLLMGLRDASVLLEVSLDDGSVVHEYGLGGDVPLAPGSAGFQWVHDARWQGEDAISLTSTTYETRVIEYDISSGTMAEQWSYGGGLGQQASVHGTASRLPDGNYLVGFGDLPWIQEVDPSGRVVWDLRFDGSYIIKSVEFVEDLSRLVGPM